MALRNLNSATTMFEEVFKSENVKYQAVSNQSIMFDGRDIMFAEEGREGQAEMPIQLNVTDNKYELTYAIRIKYDDELSVLKCINDANCSSDTKFSLMSVGDFESIEFRSITFNEVSWEALFDAVDDLNHDVTTTCMMFYMNDIEVEITLPTWAN